MHEKGLVYFFQQKEDNVVELYLYDTVTKYGTFNWQTWEYEESETSAKYFRDKLSEIPDDATIHLHINSGGGEVGEGVTIYNLLKQKSQAGCKVVGYVDGVAYSVAMDIAMACDEIHMGLGTSMLLHYPWAVCQGNAEKLREIADQLDALGTASVQLYMERARDLTEDELRAMMKAETMMDPEACMKHGFCDVVDNYKNGDPAAAALQASQQELEQIREQLRIQQEENQKLQKLMEQSKPKMADTFAAAMKMAKEERNV